MKKNIFSNLFFVVIFEYLLYRLSMLLASKLYDWMMGWVDKSNEGLLSFMETFGSLIWLIVPLVLCIVFMAFTDRRTLSVFGNGGLLRSLKVLLLGILCGAVVNGIVSAVAIISGSVKIAFNGFSFYLFAVFLAVFIQCACNEVLIRGYVYGTLRERYSEEVGIYVSSTLFMINCFTGMTDTVLNPIYCINMVLFGIAMCLFIKAYGNIWICFGFATAWKFMEKFIFGFTEAGSSSAISLYTVTENSNTFFYNTSLGNEGCYIMSIMLALLIVILYAFSRNKR